MAFESNNFKVVKKTSLPKGEINLDLTATADGDIAKVFAVSISAIDNNQEVSPGSVSFTGQLDVCMIYALDSGEISSAFVSLPFSSRFDSEQISSGEKAIIKLKVVDHSIESVSGNQAKIKVILEQSGVLVETEEVNSLSSFDNDVCVKEEEISIIRFLGSASSQVSETLEQSYRDKIKKVLGSEANILVRNMEAGANFVSVSGDLVAKVLFVDAEDRIDTVQIFDSFKQEVELEGATRESMVEAFAKLRQSDVNVEIIDDEKGSKILINVPFDLTVLAYEEISVKTIEDLYSLTHEMEVSTESFDMSRLLPVELIEGKIDGTLSLDENQPRVDKILFTFGSSAEITNATVENGEISLEGIAKTSLIYLNDDLGSINSVEIEIPFVITDKTKGNGDSIISVDAILTDVDVVAKKGRELFFDGKIKALVTFSDNVVSAVISSATVKEPLQSRDYAMQVIFAKAGDTLWDIAKVSKTRESDIAKQNPDLTFPLQDNSDVLVFYQNAK